MQTLYLSRRVNLSHVNTTNVIANIERNATTTLATSHGGDPGSDSAPSDQATIPEKDALANR